MGIRHSWVLSLLMLSQVGFGFLYLLFSTVLKPYARVGDARGNLQWQMVGKREKDRAHCLWAREHNAPRGSVE